MYMSFWIRSLSGNASPPLCLVCFCGTRGYYGLYSCEKDLSYGHAFPSSNPLLCYFGALRKPEPLEKNVPNHNIDQLD